LHITVASGVLDAWLSHSPNLVVIQGRRGETVRKVSEVLVA
jgi:hypothetical protein